MATLKMVALLLLISASLVLSSLAETNSTGKNWVLLVAGSNTWDNYRHQADVCHAYQIVHAHGIPDEQIVVMMYDDIAHSSENPTKGIIVNHPKGKDVYAGVPKDYTGKAVNPKNFLNILQGNSAAMHGIGSGKVIKSGPNDRIFVNFVDHGAPGLIAFPDEELHAKPLNAALEAMFKAKKFAQLTFYLEACESGSMFNTLLPKNIEVYATTAANAQESSYACYYDDKRNTYLGDVYSVEWMENVDASNITLETLQKQYAIVKQKTNTSHVMQYGTVSIAQEPVATFLAASAAAADAVVKEPSQLDFSKADAVPSQDVPLFNLRNQLKAAQSPEAQLIKQKLDRMLEERADIEAIVKNIVGFAVNHDHVLTSAVLTQQRSVINFDCYEPVVRFFSSRCITLSRFPYALRQLYVFVNLCAEQVPVEAIYSAMDKVCQQ